MTALIWRAQRVPLRMSKFENALKTLFNTLSSALPRENNPISL
jgi:hypothetical protein